MADDIVAMCATDIRPFSIVDGHGFRNVAEKLIAVGAQYGNVPIADVLPCSTTVSTHLETVVAARKEVLREKLLLASNFGITADGWTHTLTNHQYITTMAHFIDTDWKMHSHILAMRVADDKHTAQ